MPLYIDDPIKVIVKADPITVITTGTTSDGVVDGAYLSGATLVLERTQGLPDVTADLSALSGDTSMYVETSTFTGYTATTETTLSGLRTDVNTVSGQTDTNTSDIQLVSGVTETNETNISQNTADIAALSGATGDYVQTSDFDTYTGDTDTRLQGIESDLATVSGQTDTNTSAIGDNAADIVYLSGQTDTKLDSVVAGTNVTVDNTDPNNPIVSAVISGATDGVVTGATMNGNTLELERSNLPDVTVDLSQFDESSDITYLSGQTDLKLDITDFNVYTGDTETALNAKASETDLQLVSGVTTTNANNISNKLDSVVGGTDIGIDNTDPNNPIINFTGSSGGGVSEATFTGYTATTEVTLTNLNTGITANTASIETKAAKNPTIVSEAVSTSIDSTYDGKIIEATGTITLTFATGLVDGFQCTIVNVGTGTITIASLGTLRSKDGNDKLASQYGAASMYSTATNNHTIFGDLTA